MNNTQLRGLLKQHYPTLADAFIFADGVVAAVKAGNTRVAVTFDCETFEIDNQQFAVPSLAGVLHFNNSPTTLGEAMIYVQEHLKRRDGQPIVWRPNPDYFGTEDEDDE
ncbi:MAG: hypothetical protein V1664_01405 [Candidatus Uhrbacteria bacterium]